MEKQIMRGKAPVMLCAAISLLGFLACIALIFFTSGFGSAQNAQGGFKFVIGEGYSKAGPIPPTGNTNTRGFFEPTTKEFVKRWVMEGPTHHYALGVGHHADTIAKIAQVLGIEAVIVR